MISHDADDLPHGLWPHCDRCLQLGEDTSLLLMETDKAGVREPDIPCCSDACLAMRTLADADMLIDMYKNGHR